MQKNNLKMAFYSDQGSCGKYCFHRKSKNLVSFDVYFRNGEMNRVWGGMEKMGRDWRNGEKDRGETR